MPLTFALESWAEYYRDCQPLWHQHYAAIAVDKQRMTMAPDVEIYQELERQGSLQIITARDEQRQMVGYILSVIRPHLHYRHVLAGYEDAYYLAESHRRGFAGVKLIREAVRHMKAAGVQKVFFMCKTSPELDMSRLFERLGFHKSDYVFSQWIGDQ